MRQFIQRHRDRIQGVLSGFDRLRLRGTLRLLTGVGGMMTYPSQAGVLIKDFMGYAEELTKRLRQAVARGEFHITIHDLEDSLGGLQRNGLDVPAPILHAAELTEYAWQARYPGTEEPVNETEHHSAVALAEDVVRWAELLVSRFDNSNGGAGR